MIVLLDLDGTVCDTSHRAHLLDKKPRDWEAYSLACGDDQPIQEVVELARSLQADGWALEAVTGRSEVARARTRAWLESVAGLFVSSLNMRPPGDHRPNPEFKRGVAKNILQKWPGAVIIAIDDHPGVAQVYAELGITTLVVAREAADKGILNEIADGLASEGPQMPGPIAEALSVARDTFAKKNADYAQDTSWRSNFDDIADQLSIDAVTACDALIAVKQARLKSLAKNGRSPLNEGVKDTRLDRMVYSIINYALYLDEEAKGEAP